ncbi:chorismate mutase /prephenate dehydratase [Chromohalobacter israelensis]|nr:chorismate mutase /prephenate dehydratase [Chromohalobacter salexigens]
MRWSISCRSSNDVMADHDMSDNNVPVTSADLPALRERIDALDSQILELISERAHCAQQVAQVKTDSDPQATFYRPEREAQVLRRIMALNKGPLDDEEMARLFREIMSACLALERPVKVAYLGPEGTFTQQAALKHFGDSAVSLPMAAIDEVFREVEAGAAHFGVVPVENSTEGIVNSTLDTFMDASLRICGEVVLRIHHHLLVSDTTRRDKISRIYSHPQSLAQCRKWLDAHYPNAERVPVSSNAEAARLIKSEWHSAAIAGDMAAKRYALDKVAEKIEDRPDNSTRFLIIGHQDTPISGDDKTSIVVAMRNQPGALHDLLEPFHRHKIDLTRVETRPSRTGVWNYVFFIDFKGHRDDPQVAAVLEEITLRAAELKVLGSYPVGVL